MPAKVLGGLAGNSLDILTESEENLNTEIEMINKNTTNTTGRGLETLRNISEPCFRQATPTIEVTPEPDPGYSSRSRSLTPGLPRLQLAGKEGKVRRTTFPLLCSRPGSACDKKIANRKKSFVSSEDLRRAGSVAQFSSSNLQTLQGKISVLATVC